MARKPIKRNPKQVVAPPSHPGSAPWQSSYGLYIAGSEAIDDMKLVSQQMEAKWGVGALRMHVPADLREKFDRQRYLTNQAMWFGELEDVKTQTKRMINAYRALDMAADALGSPVRPHEQWEVPLTFGAVLVVVRRLEDVQNVKQDGRRKVVWSLDEVAAIVDEHSAILHAKIHFPGAVVAREDNVIVDPLDRLDSSLADLDDDLSDIAVKDDCPF